MGSADLVQRVVAGTPVLAAQVNPKLENVPVVLYSAAVVGNQIVYKAAWQAPWDCKLVNVGFWCRTCNLGSPKIAVDIHNGTTSVLTGVVLLLAVATHYAGTIASGQDVIAEDDNIRLWVRTSAGSPNIYDLYAMLTLAVPGG